MLVRTSYLPKNKKNREIFKKVGNSKIEIRVKGGVKNEYGMV